MPTVVSFNKRIPPAAAGSASRGTLAELMAKQKAAADAQTAAAGAQSPTIMQGIGNLAQGLSAGIREGRATTQLHEANAAVGGLMGKVDQTQGAGMDIISQMQQYDPEMAKSLLADRMQRQRTLADAEHWQPATPEQLQQLGAPAGTPIEFNQKTGEFKNVLPGGGGNTTITTGDKIETEWGKNLAKNTADMLNADIVAGKDATNKIATMGQLNALMGQAYTGSEAMISDYLQKNYGFSLGPKADATSAFGALVDHMVPRERTPGSGTTSDRDAANFKNALPSLSKSPQANKLIMGYINGMASRDQQVAEIAQQASNMPDPAAARTFYYDAVKKLPDPLANLQQTVDAINKANPDAPGATTGAPADPNAPPPPADPNAVPPMPQGQGLTPEEWSSWTPEERKAYTDSIRARPGGPQ
jgi:hypothetical protein